MRRPGRRHLLLLAPAAVAAVAVAPAAPGSPGERARSSAHVDRNPCRTEAARGLRCPDLVMRRPFGLYVDRRRGRTLLRAGNSIDSVGRGPAELHGYTRTSRLWMRAWQRIYRRGGGRIRVRTGARLFFKYAHLRRRWWKFQDAARFELWRLRRDGRRLRLVRRGPKVAYCLRDLRRTRRLRHSPRRRVYPACNTSPRARRVTLGTSPGWSDIYPPSYPEQWIDVTGKRGCFAYVHIADPRNDVYESNERNNRAQVIVRLPYRPGRQRCPGRSTGRTHDPDPYSY